MNEDVPEVVIGQTAESFTATVTDRGCGDVEIMISHEGRDLVKTTLRQGVLTAFVDKARELIATPPQKRDGLDTNVGMRETVVPVLRGPDGARKN